MRSILMPIDGEVLAFDGSSAPQFIKDAEPIRRTPWTNRQAANPIGASNLLRLRCDTMLLPFR
jgi:hypothetical protein